MDCSLSGSSIHGTHVLFWSGLSFPSPEDLPNPGIKPRSPALQADALLSEPPGKNLYIITLTKLNQSYPGHSDGKESACNTGDPGLIPGSGDPLEKGMATHSSILAWRIPWTEELGRLQSTGSERFGHD